jgi:hypothetical protein
MSGVRPATSAQDSSKVTPSVAATDTKEVTLLGVIFKIFLTAAEDNLTPMLQNFQPRLVLQS